MSKLWKQTTLIVFLLILYSVPIATVFSEKEGVSNVEKRKLSMLPTIEWNVNSIKNYPSAFNEYFSDHFSFRKAFVRSYNKFKKNFLHTTPVYGVVLGKNDWLYYFPPFSLEDLTGKMNINDLTLDSWRKSLENRTDWLRQKKVKYYFFVAPNKQTIYPEFLPKWIEQRISLSLSSRVLLRNYLQQRSKVRLIDPTDALLGNKNSLLSVNQFNYYKRDSHWNSKGAQIGSHVIIERIKKDFPASNLPREPQVTQVLSHRVGDLTNMLDMSDALQEQLSEYHVAQPCAKPASIPSNLAPFYKKWVHSYTCAKGKLSALIIHDSFGRQLNKYLREYFKRTIEVNVIEYNDMGYLVDTFHPDIIIDERVERSLSQAIVPAKLIDDDIYSAIASKAPKEQTLITRSNLTKNIDCSHQVNISNKGPLMTLHTNGDDAFFCINAGNQDTRSSYLLYINTLPALTTNISIFPQVTGLSAPDPEIPLFVQTIFRNKENKLYFELPAGMPANLRIHFGNYNNIFTIRSFKLLKFRD